MTDKEVKITYCPKRYADNFADINHFPTSDYILDEPNINIWKNKNKYNKSVENNT